MKAIFESRACKIRYVLQFTQIEDNKAVNVPGSNSPGLQGVKRTELPERL